MADETVVEIADVDDTDDEVVEGQESAQTTATPAKGHAPDAEPVDAPLLGGESAEPAGAQKPTWDLARQRKDEELARLRRELAEKDRKLSEVSAAHPSSEVANEFANLAELDEFADESAVRARLNETTKMLKAAMNVMGDLRAKVSVQDQRLTVDQIQAQLKVVALEAAKSVNAKNPQEALPEVSARLRKKLTDAGFNTVNPPSLETARAIAENIALTIKVDRLSNPSTKRSRTEDVTPSKGAGANTPEPETNHKTFAENVAEMKRARQARR